MKTTFLSLIFLAGFAGHAISNPFVTEAFDGDVGEWKLHWDVTKADPGATLTFESDPDNASNQCMVLTYNTGEGALEVAAVNSSSVGNATPSNTENIVLRFRARSNQYDPRKVRVWITDSGGNSVLGYSSKPLTTEWTEFEVPLASGKLGGRDKGAELMWPLTMVSIQFTPEGSDVGERPEKVWIDDLTFTEE